MHRPRLDIDPAHRRVVPCGRDLPGDLGWMRLAVRLRDVRGHAIERLVSLEGGSSRWSSLPKEVRLECRQSSDVPSAGRLRA